MPNRDVAEELDKIEQQMFAHMTKEAIQRYGRVKAINIDVAVGALLEAMQEVQQKKYTRVVDTHFRSLLEKHHGNQHKASNQK